MPSNDLYFAVLPVIHLGTSKSFSDFGRTEQILTLFPDKTFATEFSEEDVEGFIDTFRNRVDKGLIGGNVLGYEFHKENLDSGKVIVRVVQLVR